MSCFFMSAYIQSREEGKDQELIQSSTTFDLGYQSDKYTRKHHTQERSAKKSVIAQQVTTRVQDTDCDKTI